MERYAYMNCQSELYIKDEQIETDRPCPMCGECDKYLGRFETTAELAMLMWLNEFSGQDILDKTGYIITFTKKHDVEMDWDGYREVYESYQRTLDKENQNDRTT